MICSYHDIVSSPEWILVHLHRVQIGVRVASLSLCVEGNGSKVCSKHFLGEKHDWRLKNVVVVYLIARAAVIVPNWEIGNGLWHLEVKKRRCQKSFSRFSVTVSQFSCYSSIFKTYRLKSFGLWSQSLARSIDPNVEGLHPGENEEWKRREI